MLEPSLQDLHFALHEREQLLPIPDLLLELKTRHQLGHATQSIEWGHGIGRTLGWEDLVTGECFGIRVCMVRERERFDKLEEAGFDRDFVWRRIQTHLGRKKLFDYSPEENSKNA